MVSSLAVHFYYIIVCLLFCYLSPLGVHLCRFIVMLLTFDDEYLQI